MADLKDFVQRELNRKDRAQTIDWSKRREKWVQELKQLFEFIQQSLVAAGLPPQQFQELTESLSEEVLGRYEAPSLTLRLPSGGEVRFTPIASVIVGGFGRVDVTGPSGSVKLIAEDAGAENEGTDELPAHERRWTWNVYPGRGIHQMYALDEQGLANLLSFVSTRN